MTIIKPSFLPIRATEIPLWLWAIGYCEFLCHTLGPGSTWLGVPTFLGAIVLFAFAARGNGRDWLATLKALHLELKSKLQREPLVAGAYLLCFAFLILELGLGLFSALRPPHLPQEYDAIHYQMGVPRQLLIQHSLAWINWSVTDLWPMAMQWGMAPVSLAFSTINKLPQFIFTLGVAACLWRLAKKIAPQGEKLLPLTFPLLAFFGAHGVMIQIGSGMMDLPALYLLLLGLLGFLEKRYAVAALALAVYAGSKAFHPFQIGAMIIGGLTWHFFTQKKMLISQVFTRFLPLLLGFSLLLLARSSIVSLAATGTPLFPFAACEITKGNLCNAANQAILDDSSRILLGTRNRYGNGRGPIAFLEHFWRVSVPSDGVNNEYDYPLGLPWLLLVVLLGFSISKGGWRAPLFQLTILFWLLWWFNSHQSRWLYPTMAFGFLATIPQQLKVQKIFPYLLAVSLAFSLVSQTRSLLPTMGISAHEIQAKEEAKVQWERKGVLQSATLLYVKEPAPDHTPGDRVWVLR